MDREGKEGEIKAQGRGRLCKRKICNANVGSPDVFIVGLALKFPGVLFSPSRRRCKLRGNAAVALQPLLFYLSPSSPCRKRACTYIRGRVSLSILPALSLSFTHRISSFYFAYVFLAYARVLTYFFLAHFSLSFPLTATLLLLAFFHFFRVFDFMRSDVYA